jgi:4-aminobutyrate aminotransferase/(S)-3-amino-2-methylpropionate transaminase
VAKRKFASIKTEVPGPKSKALHARRAKAVPRGPSHATPIYIDHGTGASVTDVDGNVYIDFAGGLGCLNTGHTPERLVKSVQAQATKFLHSCFSVMPYEAYVALAERLNAVAPGTFEKKSLFVNSGAEAVENAVKIARAATGRPAIIVFEDAFHGRTLLTMSATSKVNPYKVGFGPFAPEVYRFPYAYPYRCDCGLSEEACGLHFADAVEEGFKRHVDAASVAAILVEPIQGEGGFVVPPPSFLRRLREICDKYGILLIADEVQSGMGRTGHIFACEAIGLVPDLICSAKAIAGGVPLAAVIGRADIMDVPVVGGLGGTYGGNPLACVAALEVLGLLTEGTMMARAKKIEERFRAWGEGMRKKTALIGDVRGRGAMMALELVVDQATKKPAKEQTAQVAKKAYETGLITITAGTNGNVIRTLMPLVISDEELEEGLEILSEALLSVAV